MTPSVEIGLTKEVDKLECFNCHKSELQKLPSSHPDNVYAIFDFPTNKTEHSVNIKDGIGVELLACKNCGIIIPRLPKK